jgi:hypothetical protein
MRNTAIPGKSRAFVCVNYPVQHSTRYHRVGQTHHSTPLGNANFGDALRAGISLRGWKGSFDKLNALRKVVILKF